MPENPNISKIISFLWDIAEDLRGAVPKSENQNVILPLVVLRRLDYALAPTRQAVLEAEEKYKDKLENREDLLCRTAGFAFYNKSPLTYDALLDDDAHLVRNLKSYIAGFSENVQEIFRRFRFDDVIRILDEVKRLYIVMSRFNERSKINLAPHHPKENPAGLTNHEMGTLFEHLIRRFNEDINENPGEHFTPKDVIRLLVKLVLSLDADAAKVPGISRTVADCACGTGGILTIAREEIKARNPSAKVHLFGQELNPRTWAVCKSDILIMEPQEKDLNSIKLGSTLANDQLAGLHFDLQFANPPYGFKWEADREDVEREAKRGEFGRFGAGLPRISDGQLLFLQHMIAHMNQDGKPSYVGVVFNGSPLFTGDAGSGESEIRRWILENDWLHALVALPEQMFYNTGIQTYLWVLTNKKPHPRKVLLLDVSGEAFWAKQKSVGAKRRSVESSDEKVTGLFTAFAPGDNSRVFDREEFGYRRIQVERPLRLNFENTKERIARLNDQSIFSKLAESQKRDGKAREAEIELGRAEQERIRKVLRDLPRGLVRDHAVFMGRLKDALAEADLKLKQPMLKAIVAALGERDEEAAPVIKTERAAHLSEREELVKERLGIYGVPLGKEMIRLVEYEADAELRDYENVPLKDDVFAYFDREVAPHVADAWINREFIDEKDQQLGKVGYEINFSRYFYHYAAPRDLDKIDKDIRRVEKDILKMLEEVMA